MKMYKSNKIHIGIFGKRNSGKSSLMNAILGQDFSIVSNVLGTTTDVNQKSMELLPIGPVVLMDTAGIDDVEELGHKRVEKTYKALGRVDVVIFVCDYDEINKNEIEFLSHLKENSTPTLVVINKTDLGQISENSLNEIKKYSDNILFLSLKNDKNITASIKQALVGILPKEIVNPINALEGIVKKDDVVVLVVPIDKEAPKDRIILPQVQIIRNLLDESCICIVCKETELELTLKKVQANLVVTDSQAFKKVSEIVPENIFLTSFSILFARIKGDLKTFVQGADKIDSLKDTDKVLICESCTHHAIEDDIGRVKLPGLIKNYTGKNITFENYAGYDFPQNLDEYALIIHCGACMTNRREVLNRIIKAQKANVPITNYGIAIAKCLCILPRVLEVFQDI